MIRTQVCTTVLCDVCGNEMEDVDAGYTRHHPSAGEAATEASENGWTVSDDALTAICGQDDDTHQQARRANAPVPEVPQPLPGQQLLPDSQPPATEVPQTPPTTTLCGSLRFAAEIAEVNLRESAAGRIVLAPIGDLQQPHALWGDPQSAEALKGRLGILHLAKIRAADTVVVVSDATGFIGSSTHNEIAYALSRGLPVRHDRVDLATATVTSTAITREG